jgi:hypothetical protein
VRKRRALRSQSQVVVGSCKCPEGFTRAQGPGHAATASPTPSKPSRPRWNRARKLIGMRDNSSASGLSVQVMWTSQGKVGQQFPSLTFAQAVDPDHRARRRAGAVRPSGVYLAREEHCLAAGSPGGKTASRFWVLAGSAAPS